MQQNEITPLVSIIVITYNSSKYVLETLESAKTQTYQNIELIISDDCSTDDTVDICKEWLEENRERFVRTELITVVQNAGIPANCNRGIKACEGEWVKLIAGDDLLLETCLLKNINFVENNNEARFILSKVKNIGSISKKLNKNDKVLNTIREKLYSSCANDQRKIYIRFPIFMNSPTFFIKSNLLKEIKYFDDSFNIYEDIPLLIKIFNLNVKVYFLDEVTVMYRIRNESISRRDDRLISLKKKKEKYLIFKKYQMPYLKYYNLYDLSVIYDYWVNCYLSRYVNRYVIKAFNFINFVYIFRNFLYSEGMEI